MLITKEELREKRTPVELPDVVRLYLDYLYPPNAHAVWGANNFIKDFPVNYFHSIKPMAYDYVIITRSETVLCVIRIDMFEMGYVADLEIIANTGIVSKDKLREIQLRKFGDFLCCFQISYLSGESARRSTTDYTEADFIDTVKKSYILSTRL